MCGDVCNIFLGYFKGVVRRNFKELYRDCIC